MRLIDVDALKKQWSMGNKCEECAGMKCMEWLRSGAYDAERRKCFERDDGPAGLAMSGMRTSNGSINDVVPVVR